MSNRFLTASLSPHIHSSGSISRSMWIVVISLIPTLAISLWVFGIEALKVILISLASCIATEAFIDKFMLRRPITITDGSAFITGLLLAFNLPYSLPWWMVVIGSVVAIGIGKMSFGGLGCNIWNPALVGRVFLLLSFPAAMTTWPTAIPSVIDAGSGASTLNTGATLLATINQHFVDISRVDLWNLIVGMKSGSLGETGSIGILVGFVILLCTRTITWHIPVSVIGSAALLSWALGGNPILDIFAGGMLLGAVFMATDYVTSPMTHKGQIIYGILIGVTTIIIRRFGAYPEGMSFAILLGNSFTPVINSLCRPRVMGERRASKS